MPWTDEIIIKATTDVVVDGWQKCAGQNVAKPTADEQKLWLATADPAAQDWIKNNASKGPSQEMFNYTKQLIDQMK
jgi:hypothetical protein